MPLSSCFPPKERMRGIVSLKRSPWAGAMECPSDLVVTAHGAPTREHVCPAAVAGCYPAAVAGCYPPMDAPQAATTGPGRASNSLAYGPRAV